MNSGTLRPTFRYSLKWAAGVVDELAARYERATAMVCQVYDITLYDLAKYVAKPDPLWNYLKKRIKALAAWEERMGRDMDYSTFVKWEEQLYDMIHSQGQGERLDKRMKATKNKRAGIQREPEATRSGVDGSFLLSPPPVSLDFPGQLYFDFMGGDNGL